MVLLGTVVKRVDDYNVTVRIPLIHKTDDYTPDDELPVARIVTAPGLIPALQRGDVVILAFERDNYHWPIVVGQLFSEFKKGSSVSSYEVSSINVSTDATLPVNTTIGDISYQEIAALDKINENISTALSSIRSDIGVLKTHKDTSALHINDYSLNSIKKITLNEAMYGNKAKMDRISPLEGQLFFLLEE